MAAMRATAASRLGWPISTELTIGSAACSSSVFTRPSQNCALLYSAFRIVGALRWPTRPLMPIETGLPSVKARAGSWQVLQATVPSADKRPSKKNFLPSAIFSDVCGLSAGTAARVASTGTPTCLRDLGSANGPAAGIGDGLAGVCGDAFAVASHFQLASLATSPPRVSAAVPAKSVVQNRIWFPTGIRMTPRLSAFPDCRCPELRLDAPSYECNRESFENLTPRRQRGLPENPRCTLTLIEDTRQGSRAAGGDRVSSVELFLFMILVLGMQELKRHLIEHRVGTGLDAPAAPQVILLGGSAHSWEPHRRSDSE